jgi:hypothetical protein
MDPPGLLAGGFFLGCQTLRISLPSHPRPAGARPAATGVKLIDLVERCLIANAAEIGASRRTPRAAPTNEGSKSGRAYLLPPRRSGGARSGKQANSEMREVAN